MRKVAIFALLASATVLSSTSSAFAWGCYARGWHGVYGYSHHYHDREAAVARAIGECNGRGGGCHLVGCNRD